MSNVEIWCHLCGEELDDTFVISDGRPACADDIPCTERVLFWGGYRRRHGDTMNAQQYRKKPVVVEAIQWDGTEDSQRRIVTWSRGVVSGWFDTVYFLQVETLEGVMRVDINDWVIRGVKGEFYPCKPDIFDATYELAGAVTEEDTETP